MADPIHQFVIEPIIPLSIGGYDLSFTNSALWMTIAAGVSLTFLTTAMKRKALVPGRMQIFAEMIYQFVAGMIRENIGPKGREYFPLVFTVFIVVLMGNMLGMIPYSFTYTSHIIVTGILALLIFLLVMGIGIYRHGLHFSPFSFRPVFRRRCCWFWCRLRFCPFWYARLRCPSVFSPT